MITDVLTEIRTRDCEILGYTLTIQPTWDEQQFSLVQVRIADFKNAEDTKGHYDIIAEGNFKGTKVEPGKVSTVPLKLKCVGSTRRSESMISFFLSFHSAPGRICLFGCDRRACHLIISSSIFISFGPPFLFACFDAVFVLFLFSYSLRIRTQSIFQV